jgi:hypothetical protein
LCLLVSPPQVFGKHALAVVSAKNGWNDDKQAISWAQALKTRLSGAIKNLRRGEQSPADILALALASGTTGCAGIVACHVSSLANACLISAGIDGVSAGAPGNCKDALTGKKLLGLLKDATQTGEAVWAVSGVGACACAYVRACLPACQRACQRA